MKRPIIALATLTICLGAFAAEVQLVDKPPSRDWWTDVSITPFGVLTRPNLTDAPQWGAGLDVGYSINHYVSLHVANLAYEMNEWRGPAIDETSLLLRADLIRSSKERFVFYGLGGADRAWGAEDWGFSVGAGAELRLAKNISIGADCRVRAWFKQEKDLETRGFVSFRF